MKTLVLGASGATGKHVVQKLVDQNKQVKIIVRASAIIPEIWKGNERLEIVTAHINELTSADITNLISDCDSLISCLGHNISFKGLFGKPRRLVCNAIEKILDAVRISNNTFKLVLMSTTAYTNKKDGEKNSSGEAIILGLFKILLPPHADNMAVGDLLLYHADDIPNLEWVAVRPDSLLNLNETSDTVVVEKKLRSPVFNPGTTSRINAAHFMCDLLMDNALWNTWRFKTPVVYNT